VITLKLLLLPLPLLAGGLLMLPLMPSGPLAVCVTTLLLLVLLLLLMSWASGLLMLRLTARGVLSWCDQSAAAAVVACRTVDASADISWGCLPCVITMFLLLLSGLQDC
jgi:hypothetical protein